MLSVPLMAWCFPGRTSIGMVLPLLIMGDCFAVFWYKRHALWDKIWGLIPWVVVGMAAGSGLLVVLGQEKGHKDRLDFLIGGLVLGMLCVHLIRLRIGDRLKLSSPLGMFATGSLAGFATTVSNAAGPVMNLYMSSMKLEKEQFIGTTAWYYFIFNLIKLPIYLALTLNNPTNPILSINTAWFALAMFPAILLGAFSGKRLLPHIPQTYFDRIVLILTAVFAVKLLLGG